MATFSVRFLGCKVSHVDAHEIRERHLVLESKLSLVTTAARTMLELNQARRSLNVEYYILALIIVEVVLALYQIFRL